MPSAIVAHWLGESARRPFMQASAPGSGVTAPVSGSRENDATASPWNEATYTFLPSGLTTDVIAPSSPSMREGQWIQDPARRSMKHDCGSGSWVSAPGCGPADAVAGSTRAHSSRRGSVLAAVRERRVGRTPVVSAPEGARRSRADTPAGRMFDPDLSYAQPRWQ